MLSLPTGHYVNTYAPLEKKAEDLLNLSDGTPLIVASAAVGAVTSGRRPGRCLGGTLHRQNHSVLL